MLTELLAISGLIAAGLAGVTATVLAYALLSRPAFAAAAAALPGEREPNPLKHVLAVLPGLGPIAVSMVPRRALAEIVTKYQHAGEPGRVDSTVLAFAALVAGAGISLALMLVLSLFMAGAWWFAGIAGFLLGPGFVAFHLRSLAGKRITAIRRAMPYVLDLLVLSTRAGSSLPLALRRSAQDYPGHPLSREFERMLVDMEMGATRRDAFAGLLARCPTEEMRAFVDTVLVAEELGRPVSDALEQLSDRLRTTRVQSAEDAAGAAGVYVAIPTMLVFIAILILLFAPFIAKWLGGGYGA